MNDNLKEQKLKFKEHELNLKEQRLTLKEHELKELGVTELKTVEFYAAQVNAWINTKFEHDKSLLTLSAGGIGLLITLISTTGVRSITSLILYVLALVAFIVCLGALLWIFRRNAKHLEGVVMERETSDPFLALLDNTAIWSFLLGVIISSIIGIATAVHSYEKEHKMAEDKVPTNQSKSFVNDSVIVIKDMEPGGQVKGSVDGISKMNPIPSTTTPTTSEKKK
jgi:hypothetical protein